MKQISQTLINLDNTARELTELLSTTDNLLSAYVEEYGDKLLNDLLEQLENEVEAEVVEAEEEIGPTPSGYGLHPQVEAQEEETVLEDQNENE